MIRTRTYASNRGVDGSPACLNVLLSSVAHQSTRSEAACADELTAAADDATDSGAAGKDFLETGDERADGRAAKDLQKRYNADDLRAARRAAGVNNGRAIAGQDGADGETAGRDHRSPVNNG